MNSLMKLQATDNVTGGKAGYGAIVLAIAALYSILTWITPLYLDDWSYLSNWRDDVGNTGFSLQGLLRYYEYVRGYDNGRIALMLCPLPTAISPFRELFPVINGALVAYIIVMSARFAGMASSGAETAASGTGSRDNGIFRLALTWGCVIVFLPWSDTIFVAAYSLNYIWASAITLAFLYLLYKGERTGWTPLRGAVCIFLAILTGGWHESIALAALCGLGLLVLIRKFRFSPMFFIAAGVCLASTVAFMFSPGMLSRIGNNVGHVSHTLPLKFYLGALVPAAIMILLLFFQSGRRIVIETIRTDIITVCIGAIIAGYVIGLASVNTPRSFFFPNLAGAVLTVALIIRMLREIPSRPGPYRLAAGGYILAVACIFQTIAVIYWQERYTEDWRNVITRLEASPSGTVFYDSPNPTSPPFYTLGIPTYREWRNPYHYRLMWHYWMTPVLSVVPTDLEYADFREGTPISGSREAALYRGRIIAPYEKLDTTTAAVVPVYQTESFRFPDGREESRTFVAYPFVTSRGDTLLYFE